MRKTGGRTSDRKAGRTRQKRARKKGKTKMTVARVGKQAPDFETSAYVSGEGFKNIKLSDYQGQWVVVCFYPGDFTFV